MNEKKKDYLLKTLIMQFCVCLLIFGALFALDKTESSLITVIKDTFSAELEKTIGVGEIKEAFLQLASDNKKESGVSTDGDVDTSAPPVTETAPTTENDSTDSTENTEPQVTGTSKGIISDDELTVSVLAEGGNDQSVDGDGTLPSNISLKKFKLNKRIYLPVKGVVSSEFGFRIHPISGVYGFHSGIDLAVSEGTNICAALDGKVVEAGFDKWNGNYIKLLHDNNMMTVYCHCKKLNVKKNTVVRGGEVIALVGSTGSSTGPHLHFEFRIDGISYNPKYVLNTAVNAV